MIAKTAIENFLARRTRNLSLVKLAEEQQLDRELAMLTPPPRFHTPPRTHQKAAFLCTIRWDLFLRMDMGTGKTKVILDTFRYLKDTGRFGRAALVLVPNVVNLSSWEDEIAKHAPDLTCSAVRGHKEERIDKLYDDVDIVLCTYAGFVRYCCAKQQSKRGKGNQLQFSQQAFAKVARLFGTCVFDESTELKNWRSLTYRVCRSLASVCKNRYCMSGTPLSRDVQDLWSQFYVVDRGASLGQHLGMFRAAFFTEKREYWGNFKYTFKQSLMPQLRRMMWHSSIQYAISECASLPQQMFVRLPIVMSDEAWAYYSAVIAKARQAAIQDELVSSFMQALQICSGFVNVEGQTIDFSPNPKLDAATSLIQQILESSSGKLVVYHTFIHSGDLLVKRLKALKVPTSRLAGGTTTQEADLHRFVSDPSIRVLVANTKCGAQGINLQCANYMLFYEAPTSPILRAQAERRIYRQGQELPCVYYDLYIAKSVEERVLRYLAEGREILQGINKETFG